MLAQIYISLVYLVFGNRLNIARKKEEEQTVTLQNLTLPKKKQKTQAYMVHLNFKHC